jgi:hypothetical protein
VSSKGRAPKTTETGHEFYPTPDYAITPLLDCDLLMLPGGVWVEPCVGTGNIVNTINRRRPDVRWVMYDIDERVAQHCAGAIVADFLAQPTMAEQNAGRLADVLIMNPPFSLALEFAARAFQWASWVVMLQRLNWFGSQKRREWLRTFAPDVYVLPKRPSFRPDGQTDSIEYAWFVWPPTGRERRSGWISMLDMPVSGQLGLGGAA